MNQIARETGISKGKVHYLINDWKNKIGASDIDEIREFLGLSRKSNISIEQCALGFRMINILKNLGIENGDIASDDDDDDNNNDIVDNCRDSNNNNYKELFTFVEDIYKNCKKLNIQPAIIPSWIKDLLDFNFSFSSSSSSSYSNNKRSFSLIDIDEKENDIDDKRQTSSIKIKDATKDFLKDTNKRFDFNLDDDTKSDLFIKDITSDLNPNPTIDNSSSSSSSEIKIPFISQVSFYIAHKKKELVNLISHQKTIEKDIQKLEVEKSTVIDNLNLITQKETHIISYIEFFCNLEKELWNNYSIKLKDDIQGFSQLINDFREHGYDALEIIKECFVA